MILLKECNEPCADNCKQIILIKSITVNFIYNPYIIFEISLFKINLNTELRKKLASCYVCSIALYQEN